MDKPITLDNKISELYNRLGRGIYELNEDFNVTDDKQVSGIDRIILCDNKMYSYGKNYEVYLILQIANYEFAVRILNNSQYTTRLGIVKFNCGDYRFNTLVIYEYCKLENDISTYLQLNQERELSDILIDLAKMLRILFNNFLNTDLPSIQPIKKSLP